MANAFSKEEIVFFEQVLQGFDPNNITARQVMKYMPPSTQFERSALSVNRPVPYISVNKDGLTLAEADFADITQLSVPSKLNANASAPSDIKNVPFTMNAVELNDAQQRDRKAESAVQALSALVDKAIATEVAQKGTLFVKDTVAAGLTTYSQFARCEELMSIRDVAIMEPRTIILNPADYNGVAGDLAKRDAPMTGTSLTAFERSMIPRIATFDSFKANFMPTQAAKAGTNYVLNGANQDHDPKATDANGNNVDNRSQTLNVKTGTGVIKKGDAFTIAGVFAVSHIHKNVTNELQTFRVLADAAGAGTQTITISPAIVVATGGGGAQPNKEYANCSAIPVDSAVIVFLNTVAAPSNIFFINKAVEIVHGSLATMDLNGAGVSTMTESTDSGIQILFAKGADIKNLGTEYRLTIWFAPNVLIPEMCGNIVGKQT